MTKTITNRLKRLGFTLIEVNLAIFIMATGILTMIALYPLGYKEAEQSEEDVFGAIAANNVINAITARLQDPNLTWSQWEGFLGGSEDAIYPSGGWGGYYTNLKRNGGTLSWKVVNNPTAVAEAALSKLSLQVGLNALLNVGITYKCAVVLRYGVAQDAIGNQIIDKSCIAVSVRVSDRRDTLLTKPMYYTEVRYQGGFKNAGGGGK